MKLIDIIKESNLTPEEEKKKNKAKHVLFALKTGIVKILHPRSDDKIELRYKINDNVKYEWNVWDTTQHNKSLTIYTNDVNGVTIYSDDMKIVSWGDDNTNDYSKNPAGVYLRNMIGDIIESRFKKFNIKLHVDKHGMNFVNPNELSLDVPEELNEQEISDKKVKAVKAVHSVIKKGFVDVGPNRYRYELSDDYQIIPSNTNYNNIQFLFSKSDITGDKPGLGLPLKVWKIEYDGTESFTNGNLTDDDVDDIVHNDEYVLNRTLPLSYLKVRNKVRNRYRSFKINPLFTTPYK